MNLTTRSLLLLAAVILFIVDAIGVSVGAVSLLALGLACFAGSFLVSDTRLGGRRI